MAAPHRPSSGTRSSCARWFQNVGNDLPSDRVQVAGLYLLPCLETEKEAFGRTSLPGQRAVLGFAGRLSRLLKRSDVAHVIDSFPVSLPCNRVDHPVDRWVGDGVGPVRAVIEVVPRGPESVLVRIGGRTAVQAARCELKTSPRLSSMP